MRTKFIDGTGIFGMELTLSLGDMFQANQMSDTIDSILKNHKQCEEYEKTPYDKRNEAFPEGKPKRVELSDENLDKVYILLAKMSFATSSTIFKEEDEEPYDKRDVAKDEDFFGEE